MTDPVAFPTDPRTLAERDQFKAAARTAGDYGLLIRDELVGVGFTTRQAQDMAAAWFVQVMANRTAPTEEP